MSKVNQAFDEKDVEINPQARHKQKIYEDEKKRKSSAKVVDEYIEIISDHQHKNGGKVRICKKMNNGNLHRAYLGREKQLKDVLAKYKQKGIKIVR